MESLEIRRLLVGEGAVFTVNETIDGSGLPGNVTAEIAWGDGSTSPAIANDRNADSKLQFKFDYSLDTGGFFKGGNTWRRSLLELAGTMILDQFTDTLAPISPSQQNKWSPNVWHPSKGTAAQSVLHELPNSLRVSSNQIIVYVGSRNLPSSVRALGGPGGVSKFSGSQSFLDNVVSRGEPGALGQEPTDFAPSIGAVSFDSESSTNWYFGLNPDGIERGQIDFVSAATHELVHVLGFGTAPSWNTISSDTSLRGENSRGADSGSGNVALSNAHFSSVVRSADGTRPLMSGELVTGERQLLTELDLAALDDIGWEVANKSVNVTASHRYPDNGDFPVEMLLQGHVDGRVVAERLVALADVHVSNLKPSLTVAANRSATAGQQFSITDIGVITDPGFRNTNTSPSTSETFTYDIDWGDGTKSDTGTANIDRQGGSDGTHTLASFNGSHQYAEPGSKAVTVRVKDDDGGAQVKTFQIGVLAAPKLELQLTRSTVDEDAGKNASTLTIKRVDDAIDSAQTVQLNSSDSSEIRVPESVIIPANAPSASVPVDVIDDALLDGDVNVKLTASASGLDSKTIDLLVKDHEHLTASLSESSIPEGQTAGVDVTIRRSNTNLTQPVVVQVSGGSSSQVQRPATITIPANKQQVTVKFFPIDDSTSELAVGLNYTFRADGYVSAHAAFELVDNEPPAFQNQSDPHDVTGSDGVRASDVLRIINELARRKIATLDPSIEEPNGVFLDVNGDYMITALDALIVINELPYRDANGERLVDGQQVAAQSNDDDELPQKSPRDIHSDGGLLF